VEVLFVDDMRVLSFEGRVDTAELEPCKAEGAAFDSSASTCDTSLLLSARVAISSNAAWIVFEYESRNNVNRFPRANSLTVGVLGRLGEKDGQTE